MMKMIFDFEDLNTNYKNLNQDRHYHSIMPRSFIDVARF